MNINNDTSRAAGATHTATPTDPRIIFAAERTLLAWARTALSLIAFGFVIERSGLLLEALGLDQLDGMKTGAVFWLGITFITVGAIAAGLSAMQFSKVIVAMQGKSNPTEQHQLKSTGYSPLTGLFINWFLAAIGGALGICLIIFKFI